MITKTVTFTMEKDTKNTVRFLEDNEPTEYPVCRTLYISKPEHMRLGAPTKISVEITALDSGATVPTVPAPDPA